MTPHPSIGNILSTLRSVAYDLVAATEAVVISQTKNHLDRAIELVEHAIAEASKLSDTRWCPITEDELMRGYKR